MKYKDQISDMEVKYEKSEEELKGLKEDRKALNSQVQSLVTQTKCQEVELENKTVEN